ncbi:hypothetical protein [Paraflavitalea speifideaquila]|uniref:hypothetical protein n=1 Tax=Paraflavitalea speifideaquila TaxID=3076558 RepID=UPI0028EE4396|nr:hypothetical protein [Paraflavitalea speifideiaquila]
MNASLPGSTGYASAFANIGKVQNTGWEFTINTINVANKQFNWESSFNISFNKNKVVALTDNQEAMLSFVSWSTNSYSSLPSFIAKIGQPISMFYGYVFDGVYQVNDFNKNSAGGYVLKDNIPGNTGPRASVQPGNVKFKDINGDGTVDAKDQTIIGNPNPKFIGGFSIISDTKDLT